MLRRSWKVVRVSKDRKIDFPEPFLGFLRKTHFWRSYISELIFIMIFLVVPKIGFWQFVVRNTLLVGAGSKVVKKWKKNIFPKNSTHFQFFQLSITKIGPELNFWHLVKDWPCLIFWTISRTENDEIEGGVSKIMLNCLMFCVFKIACRLSIHKLL